MVALASQAASHCARCLLLQLPYIKHGAHRVADCTMILDYLANTFPGAAAVRSPGEPEDKAAAAVVERMVRGRAQHLKQHG